MQNYMNNRNDFNPRLIPGIMLFIIFDVLFVVQLVMRRDFFLKYYMEYLIGAGTASFVMSLIFNSIVKKKHEKMFGYVLAFVFILFFVLVVLNFIVVYKHGQFS